MTMTTELVELADCPFCGHEAKFEEKEFGLVAVLCNAMNGGCGATGGWDEHESEAAKLWNTRALASRAGGWISVKDRLPDRVGLAFPVLAFNAERPRKGVWMETIHPSWWGTYNVALGEWMVDVTHWHEIPEAPEPVAVGADRPK